MRNQKREHAQLLTLEKEDVCLTGIEEILVRIVHILPQFPFSALAALPE